MNTKSIVASKTFWVNLLGGVGAAVGTYGGYIPPKYTPAVMAVGGISNILLRLITNQGVTLTGSSAGAVVLIVGALTFGFAPRVAAQSAQVPTLSPATVTVDATTAQSINNAISYGTVSANVLMDVLHDFNDPNRSCAFKQEAMKVGLAVGISELLKLVIHRARPDGSDLKDFPSEHTAIATASSGWSVAWGYSLAIGTGVERRAANKHDWTGVLGGLAVGEGSKWLAPRLMRCS